MIRLSVNVNKVATLRNSRGGAMPSVLDAVDVCLAAGAPGITVHPRADQRHITPDDVRDDRARRCAAARRRSNSTSKAIRGRICSTWCDEVRPDQCTLVPVVAGRDHQPGRLAAGPADRAAAGRSSRRCRRAASASACSSMPSRTPIRWAASIGADRVELYTEPFARAFEQRPGRGRARRSRATPTRRELAHALGLGVNAGHDLDLDNLTLFRELPHPRRGLDRPRASCRARCSSASTRSSASTCRCSSAAAQPADAAIRYDRDRLRS